MGVGLRLAGVLDSTWRPPSPMMQTAPYPAISFALKLAKRFLGKSSRLGGKASYICSRCHHPSMGCSSVCFCINCSTSCPFEMVQVIIARTNSQGCYIVHAGWVNVRGWAAEVR